MMEADLFLDAQLHQNVSYPTAPALWIRYEMPLHQSAIFSRRSPMNQVQ
jgi:hypothetical protein